LEEQERVRVYLEAVQTKVIPRIIAEQRQQAILRAQFRNKVLF
jgi:hypothetical protein